MVRPHYFVCDADVINSVRVVASVDRKNISVLQLLHYVRSQRHPVVQRSVHAAEINVEGSGLAGDQPSVGARDDCGAHRDIRADRFRGTPKQLFAAERDDDRPAAVRLCVFCDHNLCIVVLANLCIHCS